MKKFGRLECCDAKKICMIVFDYSKLLQGLVLIYLACILINSKLEPLEKSHSDRRASHIRVSRDLQNEREN
jgi:hypothetical protein